MTNYEMEGSEPNNVQEWKEERPLLSSNQQHSSSVMLIFLISIITIGSHYGKHALSSLSSEIMTILSSNRAQYALLFSSQQLPGVILPVIGGFALTYLPHGPTAVILASCIALSTAICAFAVSRRSYEMLLLGRLLFGFCDGMLTTLQGALVATTLPKHAGVGFGVMLFVSRISSFAGLTFPAIISEMAGLEVAMWFSVLVCLPPLLSTITYAVKLSRLEIDRITHRAELDLIDIWNVLTSLRSSFWSISYLWMVVASVVFSMTHFIPDAVHSHFDMGSVLSGFLSGSLVFVAGLCSPVFGILQDRIGRRVTILTCCCVLLLSGSVLCAAAVSKSNLMGIPQKDFLYVGLIFIGIGFSAAPVTLMASIAIVVDSTVITAALGVYKAVENGGLALIHLGIGVLRDWSGEYVLSFLILGSLSLSGVWTSSRLMSERNLEKNDEETDFV